MRTLSYNLVERAQIPSPRRGRSMIYEAAQKAIEQGKGIAIDMNNTDTSDATLRTAAYKVAEQNGKKGRTAYDKANNMFYIWFE